MGKFAKIIVALLVLTGFVLVVFAILPLSNYNTGDRAAFAPTLNTQGQSDYYNSSTSSPGFTRKKDLHPMSIQALRERVYPGGDFTIEETLANGTNYRQYIASYLSEGLKIYGLLTVPLAKKPEKGWPAIVFVHGHIPPNVYSTTGSYPTYQARLARAGFITFKPDLRGHGNSEGKAGSAHFSPDYVIDTMNAIAYLKDYKDTDPNRIGYWGHSNGGEIGLRVLVISQDIKAASLWAGVVGSYEDMFETYNEKISFLRRASSTDLVREHGLPSENPEFWNQLDPYSYLNDISAAVQLQHATGDKSVPIELSLELKAALEKESIPVEYIEYQGDDHNIGNNSSRAWQKTIEFFKKI
jgi:dipeptidyl aminopeptidase/acylaminoacyl peptidase